jgi:hypothetical protein
MFRITGCPFGVFCLLIFFMNFTFFSFKLSNFSLIKVFSSLGCGSREELE